MHEHRLNITVGGYVLEHHFYKYFACSHVTSTSPVSIIIPQPMPYTSLEKLLWPFKSNVWHFLVGCVILALSLAATFQHFNIPFPKTFDIIRICVGLNVQPFPLPSKARLLTILLMLHFFVIRNAYQGALYSFLTNHQNRTSIANIDEMVANGYVIHLANITMPIYGDYFKRLK